MSDASHATETAQEHAPHIVGAGTLIATCVALLFLTWVTVAVSWFDLGSLNIVIALSVAFTKALVVALYFMHLRWDKPFNRIVIVSALLFVVLLIGFCVGDSQNYISDVDEGDAPAVVERLGGTVAAE